MGHTKCLPNFMLVSQNARFVSKLLEEGVTGSILKFADDTKLFRKTKEIGDKQNTR